MRNPRPGSSELIIRPATASDAQSICAVHVRSIREHCRAHYTPEQIEAWAGPKRAEDYSGALESGEVMYVAEVDGKLLGFVSAQADELRGLYIAPGAVGKGVGTALLKTIEADARGRGLSSLHLHSTINAVGFYKAHGYIAGERTERKMYGVGIPCVPMTKPLTSAR